MAWTLYHKWLEAQADGGVAGTPIDFDGDTLKIALAASGYTPSDTLHDLFDDITNEVMGTGYTAGGETLANKVVTESSGTVTFDADNASWLQNASGFANARYAILYKEGASAAISPLIAYADLGGDKGNVGGDLTLQFDATGIITWS
ncbi:MAG: hypothetical protein GKS00_21985 [Alphaproteobacteria bacterium]|nr:hypothetical protein [Alphaproteobacteria bacterium]